MPVDVTAIRAAVETRLPRSRRWQIHNTPLDFHFSALLPTFREVAAEQLRGYADPEWFDHVVIGDYDYAEGGGATPWITVRETDGRVCGLDPERKDAVFVFNSSIKPFVEVFAALDTYLRGGLKLPPNIEPRIREIDPSVYGHSEWRELIGYLTAA